MFRAIISPILRSTRLCVYSSWYNAPTMLPAGNLDEVEHSSTSSRLPAGSIVGALYHKL